MSAPASNLADRACTARDLEQRHQHVESMLLLEIVQVDGVLLGNL